MKKLCVVALVLTLVIAISTGICVSAYAEEEPQSVDIVEVVDEQVDKQDESEIKEKISQALAKINELTGEENWFKNKVLPFIINGAIDVILVGVLFMLPYLKKSSLAKQLQGYIEALQEEKANLQALLSSSNPEEVKSAVEKLFGGAINELINKFDVLEQKYQEELNNNARYKATVETLYAKFNNFIEATRLAWSSRPEVVALLAESPVKSALEDEIAKNNKLEAYIREQKGEEAEQIIKEIEKEIEG